MHIKFTTQRLLADAEEPVECFFTGEVTVDIPPHHERFKFLQESGLQSLRGLSLTKTTDADAMIDKAGMVTEFGEKSSRLVFERVVSCDLKHEDGTHIVRPEDMWSHPDATPLIEILIGKFVSNFMGKRNASSSRSS